MKHYSVNDSDLAQLSTFSGLASAFIALGSLLIGMSTDLVKELVASGFPPPAPTTIPAASWTGAQWGFLMTGGLFLVVGVILLITRLAKASQIKRETEFK